MFIAVASADEHEFEQSVATSDTSQIPYLRDPDVQLMLRAQKGDESAFAELVETYQDRLIGIFRHILSDQDAAEDLAQDVFLRVYRARDRYQPTARFSTWLFRIANNLASNKRRSKGRRREVPLNVKDSGPIGVAPQEKLIAAKSAFMPVKQATKAEMRNVVRDALDGLSERQRMALLLHKFEGMSYSDIGEAMEMSAAAVKSLLSRARENLREKLARYVS